MNRVVSWMEEFASSLGGAGLFLIAFLDSSFVSLPEITDILVILMVSRNEALMPYYAGMATLGSLSGCLVLYAIGRRGGDALVRRFAGPRTATALRLFERFGVLAVVVPALLPPPAPFKVFVLLSGVARVPLPTFTGAVAFGRGVRYFGEGALAMRYGDEAIDFLRANGTLVFLLVAGVALAVIGGYLVRRRRESAGPTGAP